MGPPNMRMPHQGPKQGPPKPDQDSKEPGAPGEDPAAPGADGNEGEPPVMNPIFANQPPQQLGPSPQKSGWGAMPYGGNMSGGPPNFNPYPTQILLPKQQRLQQQQQQQGEKKKGKKKKNNSQQGQAARPPGLSMINPVLNLISLPPPPPPPLPEDIPTPPPPRTGKSESEKSSAESKKPSGGAGFDATCESWPPSLQ